MADSRSNIPAEVVFDTAAREDVMAAMSQFYADVDREIAEKNPVCRNRGRCCRFGEFGHRLFVTTLEAAYYLVGVSAVPVIAGDACPHAYDRRCHVRDDRPLGCRVFFCDPAAAGWQGPFTEKKLAQLREMHEHFQVPYYYADWMAVLAGLGEYNRADQGRE